MENNKNEQSHPQAGTMLQQKTNEDFNKKKPDPDDPNEQDNVPGGEEDPSIDDHDHDPVEGEGIDPKNEEPEIREEDPSTEIQTGEEKTDVKGAENFKFSLN